jgi:hypothetical protein
MDARGCAGMRDFELLWQRRQPAIELLVVVIVICREIMTESQMARLV